MTTVARDDTRYVDVVIPMFQPGPWLAACVESVLASKGVAIAVWLMDDDPSSELEGEITQRWPPQGWPSVTYTRASRNLGFAATCNAGIRLGSAPYVMTLNQDARVEPDYIARLVDLMQAQPRVASAGGVLLLQRQPWLDPEEIIDTAGIEFRRGRRPVDIGQGDTNRGQYDGVREVFGVCAAAALYRREAIERLADETGIFSERFFMHKEDTDLAWRLRRFGHASIVDGRARGFHARGTRRAPDIPGDGPRAALRLLAGLIAQELAKPPAVRRLAWRNQVLMIVRNENLADLRRSFLDVLLVLEGQTLVTFVIDPIGTIVGRMSLLRRLPSALLARRRSTPTPPLRDWLP
jgi:GT2 family glycosyltransferase